MLDIKLIRENPEEVKAGIAKKNVDGKIVDEIIKIDKNRRDIIGEVEKLKAESNKVSEEVAKLKKEGKDASKIIASVKEVTNKIKSLDTELAGVEEKFKEKMLLLPNIPHESVPVWPEETANKKEST